VFEGCREVCLVGRELVIVATFDERLALSTSRLAHLAFSILKTLPLSHGREAKFKPVLRLVAYAPPGSMLGCCTNACDRERQPPGEV